MYNRYIPQDDGSYFKNRIPDTEPKRPAPPPPQAPGHRPPQPQNHKPPIQETVPPQTTPPFRPPISAGNFLRQLLPKDIDTGDLLIIVLLLLIAGDGSDDKNTALLTLALYLFL